ncbi:hypothetical protein [Mesorhizobium sp. M0041]|uniref:hypothetical protein n=2 Tax=Mesorhizobium TaxID=68287 RepID=UPI0033376556
MSTCLECFLIWHGACVVVRKASRIKENPSNDHPPKNTAAGLLGSSQDEARVSPGRMIHLARPARDPPTGSKTQPVHENEEQITASKLAFPTGAIDHPLAAQGVHCHRPGLATTAPALAATDGGKISCSMMAWNGRHDPAQIVTHMIWHKVRSADEPPGKTELAPSLERLIFRATPNRPDSEFDGAVSVSGYNTALIAYKSLWAR